VFALLSLARSSIVIDDYHMSLQELCMRVCIESTLYLLCGDANHSKPDGIPYVDINFGLAFSLYVVFKSLGLGLEDDAIALTMYELADQGYIDSELVSNLEDRFCTFFWKCAQGKHEISQAEVVGGARKPRAAGDAARTSARVQLRMLDCHYRQEGFTQ
jgi:hypothetical protein